MNNKEVFILGSGFSKALNNCMPTLSDLGKEINEYVNVDGGEDENANSLNTLYKKYIMRKGIDNFEEILTLLYQEFPWKEIEEKHIFKVLYFYISKILHKIINDNQIRGGNYSNNENLISFIKYITEHKSTVITFNYDTILETVTNQIFKGKFLTINDIYPINLEELIPINAQIHPKLDGFKLYKLHGSINWFYRANRLILKQDIGEDVDKALRGMIPFIVPPVFDKNSFMGIDIIGSLWKEAKNEISCAEKIYILGYSLPESDLATRLMLKQNLPKIAEIFLVNIDIKIGSRIKKDFNNFNINADYLIKDMNIINKFIKEKMK